MTQPVGFRDFDRDKFNRAAFYVHAKPGKPSGFKRALKKIFLCAVMAIGLFVPGRMAYRHYLKPDDTAITEVMQPPVRPELPQQVVEAQQPYVSQRAGVPDSSRGLTAGEVQLVRSIFGNSIDLSGMRLHMFSREQGNWVSDVGPGQTKNIEFYGRSNLSADFSRASGRQFGSFVHEMSYILQNQRGANWRAGNVEGYAYPLGSQWRFTDYGPAQQRAIVQDYALRFLHPDRTSQYLPRTYGDDRADTDPHLIRIVEDHFPAAKAARLAFQNIETRALTPGELALIQGIFGEQADARIMTQHFHPQDYSDIAGTATSTRDANYWGPRYYSRDFSKEQDATRFGVFVHENTHLWQFQTNFRFSRERAGVYKYPVDPAKWSFNDYTDEQQAAMMEDYATQYLHPSHTMRWLPQVYSGAELREKTEQMRQIVETRWPGARRVREQYEARQAESRRPVTISQASSAVPGAPAPAMG